MDNILPLPSAKLQTVNACVDSLDIRVLKPAIASDWLKEQLPLWRQYHQTSEPNSPPYLVELPGLGSFRLKATKSRPYEFVLINPEIADIRIWNPDKWAVAIAGATGQFYVSFRSKFLQFQGVSAVKPFVDAMTGLFCASTGPEGWIRVSRADLAADVQMEVGYQWADLDRFVTKARWKDMFTDVYSLRSEIKQAVAPPPSDNKGGATYEELIDLLGRVDEMLDSIGVEDGSIHRVISKQTPQSIYFGRFKSPLYARLYDKLASLDVQSKGYMREVWMANGWDGESPVWRHEFSLSGDFLREAYNLDVGAVEDLRDFDRFTASIGGLWKLLTCQWLKFTAPDPNDSNRWRWAIADVWAVVQLAFASSTAIARYKRPRENVDEEQLAAQLLGVAKTLAAKRAKSNVDPSALETVLTVLYDWADSPTYSDDLQERRQLLGIDDFSDTALSALYRAERMMEGLGS